MSKFSKRNCIDVKLGNDRNLILWQRSEFEGNWTKWWRLLRESREIMVKHYKINEDILFLSVLSQIWEKNH